jgi:UDP-glucose 4-epimerase
MTQRFVVTGASGFVGSAIRSHLEGPFHHLSLAADDWADQVKGTDFTDRCVLHLAARVHDGAPGSEAEYERDNVVKTRVLAEAAAAGGARRFVFLSTIKVNGEETADEPFRRNSAPHPRDAYGRSKWAAEQALARVAQGAGLEVAIVRSPLVYGPGAKGNLLTLMRLAESPWPLPFAAIRNRRSFIQVDDLARLLLACATLEQAAGRTFLAAHSQSVSTPRLVAALRAALDRPARLVGVPPWLLEAGAFPLGQLARMRRLTRSLEIDVSDTERELGWAAQVSFETAVDDMVAAYRSPAPA